MIESPFNNSERYVFYYANKKAPPKEDFIRDMNLYQSRNPYNPSHHGMLSWEEYIDKKWEKENKDTKQIKIVYYDSREDTEEAVMARIKERDKDFIEFCHSEGRDGTSVNYKATDKRTSSIDITV